MSFHVLVKELVSGGHEEELGDNCRRTMLKVAKDNSCKYFRLKLSSRRCTCCCRSCTKDSPSTRLMKKACMVNSMPSPFHCKLRNTNICAQGLKECMIKQSLIRKVMYGVIPHKLCRIDISLKTALNSCKCFW